MSDRQWLFFSPAGVAALTAFAIRRKLTGYCILGLTLLLSRFLSLLPNLFERPEAC
jgi:hypothetical protein